MEGSSALAPSPPAVKEGRVPFFVDFPFARTPIAGEQVKQLAEFNDAVRGKGFDQIKSGDLQLNGYASTWVLDRDQEYVGRHAFDKSLPTFLGDNPILLWQHDRKAPVGQVLTGDVDQHGLLVDAWHRKPSKEESDWKHDAYQSVLAGIVKTFSIGGFFDREIIDGEVLIVNVDLMELSEVSIPSNPLSIFSAAQKAAKGLPMKASEKDDSLVSQMLQLQGMVPMEDTFLRALDSQERAAYYGRLAVQFQGQKGVEAPPLRAYAEVEGGMDGRTGEETLKQVRELTELFATPDAEPVAAKGVEVDVPQRQPSTKEVRQAVKETRSSAVKAGRVLSAKNERKLDRAIEAMRSAATEVEEVLSQVRTAQEEAEDGERSVSGGGKQLSTDLHRQLHSVGRERWADDDTYVWLDDFDVDESWAVFCISPDDEAERYVRISFSRADEEVTLTGDEEPVRRTTSYAAA